MKVFLVFLIITITDFCQGKAFPESENGRGKRLYNHNQYVGLHQTYDPRSNAEHSMKEKFYEPQIDGQPIYIPTLDQQSTYNEFLDSYYKAYSPALSLVTPVPYTSETKSDYKTQKQTFLKGSSDVEKVKYAFPNSKGSKLSVKTETPEDYSEFELDDYDGPEIIERTETEFNKNIGQEAYKPKVGQLTLEVGTSEDYDVLESDDYDSPEIIEKTLVNESSEDFDLEISKLEKIQSAVEVSSDDYNNIETDYDAPEIIEKITGTQLSKDSELSPPESNMDEFEDPVLHESLKKGVSKTKPEINNQYDNKGKTVNQKTKTNVKKGVNKNKTEKNPQVEDSKGHVKVKPNKKIQSVSKYGYQTTPKTSKGKPKKQYSKSNKPRTSEDSINDQSTFEPNTSDEILDELSKDGLYPPHNTPIKVKESTVVKTNSKRKPVKTKEKNVIKDVQQYKPLKGNTKKKSKPTKAVVKAESQYNPTETKENIIMKSNPKKEPIKTHMKDKPKKTSPQYQPITTGENFKPNPKDNSMKEKVTVKYGKEKLEKSALMELNEDSSESSITDVIDELSTTKDLNIEKQLFQKPLNPDELIDPEINKVSESGEGSSFPGANNFRGLSMNSNIWSMIFNPNAEQNRLKLKRCITRSNETGFCTYIQNCDVPQIATSLEQLLNNACVMDDIFIGVCCPEFPVQTIKVQWDKMPSDFDNQMEDEFGHKTEDCGVRSNEALELQSWPWKAPLVSMSNGKIFCGGVIVSDDHILTAAHCTTKIPKNQILVRLGQYDEESGDDYAVVEIKRHAQYNPRTMHNDVALLKLGRRIMNGATIGAVCLPEEDDKNDHNGEKATLLGWRGIFGTMSQDPEFLKVITNKDCASQLGMKVPATLLCTETREVTGRTCNADSGAPLVIEDDGKYEVIGILSWNRNDCDRRFPSTFSRISSYSGWIKKHIA